jgi:hypothetical protein
MGFFEMVRAEGLEPPQLSSLEPKSSASTNSATPAEHLFRPRCPSMIAEKCEAVFGRPIMLQTNGIDHVYGLDPSSKS